MAQTATSKLIRLIPCDVGSSKVESFTAYIIRLAAEHHILPRTLIISEILPLLGRSYLYQDGKHVHDTLGRSWWNGISATLNSVNPL